MKKAVLPLILDVAFAFIAAFMFFLSFFRFYAANLASAILLAFLCAVIITIGFFFFLSKRRNGRYLKLKKKQLYVALKKKISLLSNDERKYYFDKVIEEKYAVIWSYAPLSADRFIDKFRRLNADKTQKIIVSEVEDEVLDFIPRDRIITLEELYPRFEKMGLLPEEEKKKIDFSKLKALFSRKKTKYFAFSGSILLFFSFLSFYPIYYIISGCLMLAYASLCLLFGSEAA